MLVVVPISHTDEALAENLLKHLSHEEDCAHEFPAILIISQTLADKAGALKDLSSSAFKSVRVEVLPNEDTRGWPFAPNKMFAFAVSSIKTTSPWLWLEPDSTPLTRDWATQIFTAYNLHQKPFLGTARPTRLLDAQGNLVRTDGEHMIGVGVYPPDFSSRSTLWRYLADEPFDVCCRWEIRPHATVSPLISHNWKSSKFRGDSVQGFLWDGEDQTPIPAGSVLHHGCKDGSLLACAWGKKSPAKPVKEIPKTIVLPEEDDA